MLQFFRRHQKIIFFFTTLIIVFSFVFFGTFQAFVTKSSQPDPVVYTTKQGRKVRSSQLQQMVQFLSNEKEEPLTGRNLLENNFFNEGWVSADLFETGAYSFVYDRCGLTEELDQKLVKEKAFAPYVNTQAPSLSAEAIWGFVAPSINDTLAELRQCDDVRKALDLKVKLYMTQKEFPPTMLAQTLLYSSQQTPGAGYDPRLMKGDLGLFQYKNLQDWFGTSFIEECAKLAFEVSDFAHAKGVRVNRQEVRYFIQQKLVDCYKEVASQIKDQVPTPYALYQLYLRQRGWTQTAFEDLVETMLVSQRLSDYYSKTPLVDMFSLEDYQAFAFEYATVKIKELPSDLSFDSSDKWAAFEAYVAATATERSAARFSLQSQPVTILASKAPYLVGREYPFYYTEVSLKQLESKVSLNETWKWERDPQNKESILTAFPELERAHHWETALDNLSEKRKQALDSFARAQIVKKHPEWVEEAFEKVTMKDATLLITESGQSTEFPLKGIKDVAAFTKQLESEKESMHYTQDGEHFYRLLRTKDLAPLRVLTYQECLSIGLEEKLRTDFDGQQLFDELKKNYATEDKFALRFKFLFDEPMSHEEAYAYQFKVLEKIETVSRANPLYFSMNQVLELKKEKWAQPTMNSKGVLYTYQVLDHQVDTSAPVARQKQLQQCVCQELKKEQVRHFLTQQCQDAK